MNTEFSIRLAEKDMYWFGMHHAYAGSGQGAVSVLAAMLCFFSAGRTYGTVEIAYTMAYAGIGLLFLFYLPVHLYRHAKRQFQKSEALRGVLHYAIDETGIHVSQNGEMADLPWEQVYKIASSGRYVLAYSSRVHAYILPRRQIEGEYAAIRQLAKEHLPKYRFKMKQG